MPTLALLTLLLVSNDTASATTSTTVIRVGIVAYEDFHGEVEHFEGLFKAITQQDSTFRFEIAVGSYGEVLHWIDRQLIDVAILTPGAFASRLTSANQAPNGCNYLATIQLRQAKSTWASAERKKSGFHESYRSVCLVPDSSPIRDADDLKATISEGSAELLMVHPLSVSGRVAPLEALKRANVTLQNEQVRYTYSHSQSIRMLSQPPNGKDRVAFVWDDAAGKETELAKGVRRIPFAELEELEIPHDVIVARNNFPRESRLQELLQTIDVDAPYRFARINDWRKRYSALRDWLSFSDARSNFEEAEMTSLDEIGQSLLLYASSQPNPPRLAVVLSGGGAKCSYQVGVVTALEERLAELRTKNPKHQLDIGLVVGTSGGAINSIPIALGISSTAKGQEAFRQTWGRLDQRDIVQPSVFIRINMGLWFAVVQTSVVIFLVWRFTPDLEKRAMRFAVVYTLLALIEILFGYLHVSPWNWLGPNHLLHHAWLWLGFGVRASAWSLFVVGLGAIALETARRRSGRHITIPKWLTTTTMVGGLLGLPIIQLLMILFLEDTLTSGRGMERALATNLPRLINEHLEQQNLPPLDTDSKQTAAQQLQDVSSQLINRGLLKRDLVITGSCLSQTSEKLPSDLYFYAPARNSPTPPFGERGLSLTERPNILLDVVMGSGSIFPVFPARKIEGVPQAGEHIELVDGGFAHNSPVEAAVLWGATHIVLIEATPLMRSERGNFLKNATSSFRHLHRQAQLLDARSRDKVTVFSLSPEPPHICVLDFANNLIAASIERGYQDATTTAVSNNLRFRKELGEPIFVELQ